MLVGQSDPFAEAQIARHGSAIHVFSLQPPATWNVDGVARAAREQAEVLEAIRCCLAVVPPAAIKILSCQQATDLWERDRRCVWHPYTSLQEPDPPLVSIAAQDEYLWLADGRRVIDAISSWWTILHGHRHPRLMAALRSLFTSISKGVLTYGYDRSRTQAARDPCHGRQDGRARNRRHRSRRLRPGRPELDNRAGRRWSLCGLG